MKLRFIAILGLGVLALSLTGCPPKAQVQKDASEDEAQKNQPVEEPSLRGKEYKEVPDLSAIYFDLDQSTLRNDARETLRKNYEALRTHKDWEALVEGHCDERGTTEYNLGLGQRRAASVRQYYMSLGISGRRIATLSFGKEKPVCEEQNEDCWSKNRRAATKARINPGK
ncbi:MAG: peptidoglycan-associated lipoprotein [Elusimicrobia bacterium RIFCSPLOWO2_01_FULL_59_12]|nr:MAG: peptidoglycan-associated lipoprotein [Elusimicrobia bacterium RIFCSPLOWO2_01_FULL_59_12]